jgi:glucuronate isomerase
VEQNANSQFLVHDLDVRSHIQKVRPPAIGIARDRAGSALLNPDRFFDSDPAIRGAAREIYEETRGLPLVCPHGHVDPALLAENAPFPEPTGLLITPDHYIYRMLYSQGIRLEELGIPTRDGSSVATDPRRIWQTFADNYYLFRGTPTGVWLDYELYDLFGVDVHLTGDTASRIYDEIRERLSSAEYLPRALFERFNIEVLVTTDAATETLEHHETLRNSGWNGRVLPCFRPDAMFRVAAPEWRDDIAALGEASGRDVTGYRSFITALEERRAFFKSMGATATDHAVIEPYTERLSDHDAESLFERALRGRASPEDQDRFEAHMLIDSARMSVEDGLVMQLHAGAYRDHNEQIFRRFGADKGGDIPVRTEYTRNLRALLNAYGNDPRLTLVVFTLDESTYARELAPLAGHYPALRLGPPWWFHDSIEGMMRYRETVTATAGIYNTSGFNDDTRAFCSIPARHDLSRRVDANWLGGLVARHVIDLGEARHMARALTYDLARDTYKLKDPLVAKSAKGKESAA